MAVKKTSRTATKKLKDKWRAKEWYTIHAPDMFEGKEIPATPADEPGKLMGRVVEVTMQELTGDFSKSYIKLKLKINRIAGFDAYSTFIGHEFTTDYIRRLTRRRRTKIDGIFDVTTRDGYRIRVKPMAIAENRIQSSQKAAIRERMHRAVREIAAGQMMGDFIGSMIRGDLSRDIFKECKPIYRLKRIDVRRSDVLGQLTSHRAVEDEPLNIDAANEDDEGRHGEGESTDIDAVPEMPGEDEYVPAGKDGETGEGGEDGETERDGDRGAAPESPGDADADEEMPPPGYGEEETDSGESENAQDTEPEEPSRDLPGFAGEDPDGENGSDGERPPKLPPEMEYEQGVDDGETRDNGIVREE